MNLALTINGWLDEEVIFAQQLGAKHVFAQVNLHQVASPGWDPHALAGLHNRIEKAGLTLAGICAVITPGNRGLPPGVQKAEALEWACRLVEAAGAAGIGLVRPPTWLFPTSLPARKDLLATLARWAETAARAGVKIAIPADRLLAPMNQDQGNQGVSSGLLKSLQNPFVGLDGIPSLLLDLLGEPPSAGLKPSAGSRQVLWDKLFLVTFENNPHRGSKQAQARPDAGVEEMLTLCRRLKQAGYSGFVRLGQQPHWKGDSPFGHRAQAFATGYLRAVLQAIQ